MMHIQDEKIVQFCQNAGMFYKILIKPGPSSPQLPSPHLSSSPIADDKVGARILRVDDCSVETDGSSTRVSHLRLVSGKISSIILDSWHKIEF